MILTQNYTLILFYLWKNGKFIVYNDKFMPMYIFILWNKTYFYKAYYHSTVFTYLGNKKNIFLVKNICTFGYKSAYLFFIIHLSLKLLNLMYMFLNITNFLYITTQWKDH